jgi:hypothetical protein
VRLVVYSVLRLVLFAAALGLGYALGLRSWLLVLVAAVIAAATSYLVLRAPRNSAAAELAEWTERRHVAHAGSGASATGLVANLASGLAADAARRADSAGAVVPGSSEGESDAEQDAVGELEEAGVAQHGDELQSGRAS